MFFNDRETIIRLTPQWTGPRLDDGRPMVSRNVLDRMRNITFEEAWGPLWNQGYRNNWETNFRMTAGEQVLVPRIVNQADAADKAGAPVFLVFQALQHGRADLVQPQEDDAGAHGHDGRRRAGGVIDEGRHFFRQRQEPDEAGKRDDHGDAQGHARLMAHILLLVQGPRFRNGGHQADGQGRREDGAQVDQGHRHAGQVAEQLRGVAHVEACRFEAVRHDGQVQVGRDG